MLPDVVCPSRDRPPNKMTKERVVIAARCSPWSDIAGRLNSLHSLILIPPVNSPPAVCLREKRLRASVDLESERPSRRRIDLFFTHQSPVRSKAPCHYLKILPFQPTPNFQ